MTLILHKVHHLNAFHLLMVFNYDLVSSFIRFTAVSQLILAQKLEFTFFFHLFHWNRYLLLRKRNPYFKMISLSLSNGNVLIRIVSKKLLATSNLAVFINFSFISRTWLNSFVIRKWSHVEENDRFSPNNNIQSNRIQISILFLFLFLLRQCISSKP